jgi:transcriptional regulator
MYIPKAMRVEDPEKLKAFVRENGFGILFSSMNGKPWATHIPMTINEDCTRLTGHVSRANPHWKHFENGAEVLAVFNGPHAYVSSSWYDHENVPTWNYIAVHVSGQIRLIDGEELVNHLKTLVDQYEAGRPKRVSVETMTPEFFARESRGLIAFEVAISKMEAAYKLSQNRDDKNYTRIVEELKKSDDSGAAKVAEEMEKMRSDKQA